MRRASFAFALGAALLAACGASAKPSGTISVKEIASATNEATSLRFSTDIRYEDGTTGMPYTGEVDENKNASMVIAQPGEPDELDMIWSDRRVFYRVVSPDKSVARGWCEQNDPKFTKGYEGVQVFDTLASLDGEGRALHRIGSDRVRGTDTVHYALDGADPPVDLWVDDQDRLRRLIWTHEGSEATDTVEDYDYGAPIEITFPHDAPPCPEFPPGFEKQCVLGQSYDEPPKCPDDASDKLGFLDPAPQG